MPITKTIITQKSSKVQFKYHETTASWNFFSLRIAIVPPPLKKGHMNSAISSGICELMGDCDEVSVDVVPRITVKIPPIERTIITISKSLIFSFSIKKAKIMVTSGPIFSIMAISVSGNVFAAA